MEFVDYYAALKLARNADGKQIRKGFLEALEVTRGPEQFQLCTEAYSVLRNRYKRARYDRSLGYLMMVQAQKEDYLSAAVYSLSTSRLSSGFRALIQAFRNWINTRYDLTWEEAQSANFAYQLKRGKENPSLLLRFPTQSDLETFAAKALSEKFIRSFD